MSALQSSWFLNLNASNAWSTDNKFSSFKKHLQVFECDDAIKLQRIKKQSFYWIRLLKFFFFLLKKSPKMWTVIHPVSFLHTLAILHLQLRVQPFFSFLRFIGWTKKKRLLQPAVDIICEHRDRALSCFSENPHKCLHGIRAVEYFEKTTIMSMRCNIKRLGYGLRKFWILCT